MFDAWARHFYLVASFSELYETYDWFVLHPSLESSDAVGLTLTIMLLSAGLMRRLLGDPSSIFECLRTCLLLDSKLKMMKRPEIFWTWITKLPEVIRSCKFLLAHGTGEPLFPRMCSDVTGQLVRPGESLIALWPGASEWAFTFCGNK